MGVSARLVNFVQAAGVAPAAVITPVSQAPLPLDVIALLYGCRVTADVTAAFGAGARRTTDIALVPSANATAFIIIEQGGEIVGTNVTAPGLNYILPPIVRPIQSVPTIGGPPTGVGGLLRSFLNVQQTAVNQGGGAFNPATASIAFIGGLPPADSNRAFRGCVNHLRVVDPGFGYPVGTTIVVMNGGDPSRVARARAVFDASGRLRDIIMLDMGARYTAVPDIGFILPAGSNGPRIPAKVSVSMAEGNPATATLTIVAGIITAVNMVSLGGGYVFVPVPVVDPGGPLGSGFVGTPRMGVERIDIIAGGTGYYLTAPGFGVIVITPQFQEFFPSPNPPATDPLQATAFGVLQTPAIAQQSLSPVVPTTPVIT